MSKRLFLFVLFFVFGAFVVSTQAGIVSLGSGSKIGYDSISDHFIEKDADSGNLVSLGQISRESSSSGFNSCPVPKILSNPIPGTNLYKECICPAEYKTIDTSIYVGVGDPCDGKYKDYACIDGKPLQADGSCSCDDGYYWDGSNCIICPAGSKCADDIKDLCDENSSDYQDTQGQSVCKTCPDGYEVSADRTQCTACLPGEYSTGGAPCDPCASGECSVAGASQCFARDPICQSTNSAVEALPDDACKYTTEGKVFNKQPGETCSGTASGTCYVVEDACEVGEVCENKGTEGVCEYYGKMVFTVPVTAASPSASAYVYSPDTVNVDCGNGTKGGKLASSSSIKGVECLFDAEGDYKVTVTGKPISIKFKAVEGSELLELSLSSLVENSKHASDGSCCYSHGINYQGKDLRGLVPDLSKLTNFVDGSDFFVHTVFSGFAPGFKFPPNLENAYGMFNNSLLDVAIPSLGYLDKLTETDSMFWYSNISGFADDFDWPKNLENAEDMFYATDNLSAKIPSMANIEGELDANEMFRRSAITGFADDFDWPKNFKNARGMFVYTENLAGKIPSMANIEASFSAESMFDACMHITHGLCINETPNKLSGFADDFDWPKNLLNANRMFRGSENLVGKVPSMANIETGLNAIEMFSESGVTGFADDFAWPKNLTNAYGMFAYTENLLGEVPSMANIEAELDANSMFQESGVTGFSDDFDWPKNLTNAYGMFSYAENLSAKIPSLASIEAELNAYLMFNQSGIIGFADDFDWPKNLTNAYGMFASVKSLTDKIPSMVNIEAEIDASSMFSYSTATGFADDFDWPKNLTNAKNMFAFATSLAGKIPSMANIEASFSAESMFSACSYSNSGPCFFEVKNNNITGFADDFVWPKNLTNASRMFYEQVNLKGLLPDMSNITGSFGAFWMFFGTSLEGLAPGYQLPPNVSYANAKEMFYGIKNWANFSGTCPNPTANITQDQLKTIFAGSKVDCDVATCAWGDYTILAVPPYNMYIDTTDSYTCNGETRYKHCSNGAQKINSGTACELCGTSFLQSTAVFVTDSCDAISCNSGFALHEGGCAPDYYCSGNSIAQCQSTCKADAQNNTDCFSALRYHPESTGKGDEEIESTCTSSLIAAFCDGKLDAEMGHDALSHYRVGNGSAIWWSISNISNPFKHY